MGRIAVSVAHLALFRAADVLLDTSVKAGLNLIPFEFIAAHHDDLEGDRQSVVHPYIF